METREKIKKAALKLFLRKGFVKTTIGEIESAAGLAPRAGSFYRHFSSKQDLLLEIAETEISEQPAEFGFARIESLGNTRAELLLIAQVYEQAAQRQKQYLPLIEEIRRVSAGRKLENKANQQMLDALVEWISTKPAAQKLSARKKNSLCVLVFGSWLFYLTKWQQGVTAKNLDRDRLIHDWADHWADHLDNPRR